MARIGGYLNIVYKQKRISDRKRRPLITVNKGMILREALPDCGGLLDLIVIITRLRAKQRRRSELVGFEFEDVTCLLNGNPALRLKFSKADQYGEGRLVGISKDLEELIAQWGDLVGCEGNILRSVDRHGNIGEKLEPSAVSYILRQVQANITLPGNKNPPVDGAFVLGGCRGRPSRKRLYD